VKGTIAAILIVAAVISSGLYATGIFAPNYEKVLDDTLLVWRYKMNDTRPYEPVSPVLENKTHVYRVYRAPIIRYTATLRNGTEVDYMNWTYATAYWKKKHPWRTWIIAVHTKVVTQRAPTEPPGAGGEE